MAPPCPRCPRLPSEREKAPVWAATDGLEQQRYTLKAIIGVDADSRGYRGVCIDTDARAGAGIGAHVGVSVYADPTKKPTIPKLDDGIIG